MSDIQESERFQDLEAMVEVAAQEAPAEAPEESTPVEQASPAVEQEAPVETPTFPEGGVVLNSGNIRVDN